MNDSSTSQPSTRYDLGLDKITITTLVAGAINVIGGATAIKGWLLDVGIRYFDSLGIPFGLPRGVFIPSERRILQTGYANFIEVMGPRVAFILFIAVVAIVNLLAILSSKHKADTSSTVRPKSLGWRQDMRLASRNFYRILSFKFVLTISIFVFGYFTYQAIYKVPNYANKNAERIAEGVKLSLKKPGCPSCQTFGKNKVVGIAIFADDKTIFVAALSGGLVRIPLDDIVISGKING